MYIYGIIFQQTNKICSSSSPRKFSSILIQSHFILLYNKACRSVTHCKPQQ